MPKYETDIWPFIQAKHFKPAQRTGVRVIVIHDMEFDEVNTAAEAVAHYFATTTTPASAHICVDNNSIVQCVHDRDVAYAAPGCNNDGIQVELAGYGKQNRCQWQDLFSAAMLKKAADAVAQYCLKYNIPPVHLTNAELAAGAKGIIGHYQASEVYKKSDHADPGPGFPWDIFLADVQTFIALRKTTNLVSH